MMAAICDEVGTRGAAATGTSGSTAIELPRALAGCGGEHLGGDRGDPRLADRVAGISAAIEVIRLSVISGHDLWPVRTLFAPGPLAQAGSRCL